MIDVNWVSKSAFQSIAHIQPPSKANIMWHVVFIDILQWDNRNAVQQQNFWLKPGRSMDWVMSDWLVFLTIYVGST